MSNDGPNTPTLVAYTTDEVLTLLKLDVSGYSCIALSPIAAHAMRQHGLSPLTPRAKFTDRKFARAIAAYRRQAKISDKWLDSHPGVTDSFRYMMRNALRSMTTTVYRLDACLDTAGPWLYVTRSGEAKLSYDREEAYAGIFLSVLARWPSTLVGYVLGGNPPFPKIFRMLRNGALRMLPKHENAVIVQRREHPYGLFEAFIEQGCRLYYVGSTENGWTEYFRLAREVWRAFRKDSYVQFRIVALGPTPARALLAGYVETLEDARIKRGFKLALEYIIEPVECVLKYTRDAEAVVGHLTPKMFAAYEIADGHSAAVADAAGKLGVPRIIANHNTHAPCSAGISGFMAREVFLTLHPKSLTDIAVCWTPDSVMTAEEAKNSFKSLTIRRVVRPMPVPTSRRRSKERLVLYAGNFHRWFHVSNWMFELSDEFLEGLRAFCEATADMEDVRIVSRIKFRLGELHREAVEEVVGQYSHLDLVARSDRSFEEDLVDCDVLVSYSSTTIHQALAFRRPVLLWGGSSRYRRIKGQSVPPTLEQRSAVYTCLSQKELKPMLSGILSVHAGSDLPDAEIVPYVHGIEGAEPAPEVMELAHDLSKQQLMRL